MAGGTRSRANVGGVAALVGVVLVQSLLVSTLSISSAGAAGAIKTTASILPSHVASNLPGSIINSQLIGEPTINGTTYRVEYWSRSVPKNKPVKVTGLVVVPAGTPPAGGWPVVSWGHPTDGMTGNCAPSLDPTTAVPYLNDLLAQGWEVTESDYLNENAFAPTSKKVLPYFVGEEAARNVVDIVRAARNLPGAHASPTYQVWGWSEGGQTALWADQIASAYAPELTLKGVVATAPAAEVVAQLYPSLSSNAQYWPLLLMLADGVSSTYGSKAAPLSQLLTKTGIKLIGPEIKIESSCLLGILQTMLTHYTFGQVFLSHSVPPTWQPLLNESDPADFPVAGSAPALIVHGSVDTTAPTATTSALAQHL